MVMIVMSLKDCCIFCCPFLTYIVIPCEVIVFLRFRSEVMFYIIVTSLFFLIVTSHVIHSGFFYIYHESLIFGTIWYGKSSRVSLWKKSKSYWLSVKEMHWILFCVNLVSLVEISLNFLHTLGFLFKLGLFCVLILIQIFRP